MMGMVLVDNTKNGVTMPNKLVYWVIELLGSDPFWWLLAQPPDPFWWLLAQPPSSQTTILEKREEEEWWLCLAENTLPDQETSNWIGSMRLCYQLLWPMEDPVAFQLRQFLIGQVPEVSQSKTNIA